MPLTSKEKSSLTNAAHERNIKHREDSHLTLLNNGLNNVSSAFENFEIECKTRAPVYESFPHKLYAILSSGTFKNIITFSDDGKSWKVINKKLLEKDVLPEYFRTGKYLSFTRNVLGWGFQRNGKATYYHKLFCRGQPEKLDSMLRISASELKFMEKEENKKKKMSESSRYLRNSSYHMISGTPGLLCDGETYGTIQADSLVETASAPTSLFSPFPFSNSSRSDVLFGYNIKQELKENIKYLNLTQQVLHSQDSISPYPIYNNNYFANERSNGLHTMIPKVNFASNNYREDMNRPSSSSYHNQLYYEGIGLCDSKARMMMNRNQYIATNNNLSTQNDAIFGRSDLYPYLPHNGCNTIQNRWH